MEQIEFLSENFTYPKESNILEFKEASFALPKSFWESVSAFANSQGGQIVLGIQENQKEKSFKIKGVDDPDRIIKTLFNENNNQAKINMPIISQNDVIKYKVFSHTVIQVNVRKVNNEERPVYLNNSSQNCYVRTDDGDRKATFQQYKYFIVDSQSEVDTELLDNYDMDDLDLTDILSYKKLMAKNMNDSEIINKDNFDFLKDIGVFKRDRTSSLKKYKLTVGGLLFFGKFNSITQRFPHFQLDYFKYLNSRSNDWTDRVSSGDMNFPSLNVYSFYNLVLDKLIAGIPDLFLQDEELTRSSYHADLKEAAKEALVNVLMHPYYDGEQPVKIIDCGEFFEFSNPGEMRVSVESFLRGATSISRNPIISTLFRKIGVSEKAASGGPRIYKAATKNHLHFPDIISLNNTTLVRIWKIDLLSALKDDNINLSQEEEKILKFTQENIAFKFADIKLAIGMFFKNDYMLRKSINMLVDKNILFVSGKGKATIYQLKLSETQNELEGLRFIKRLEDIMYDK